MVNNTRTSFDYFQDQESLNKYFAAIQDNSNTDNVLRLKKLMIHVVKTCLTEKQKKYLIDAYFKNLPITEIARRDNKNPSTISRHISIAKKKIQNAIDINTMLICK